MFQGFSTLFAGGLSAQRVCLPAEADCIEEAAVAWSTSVTAARQGLTALCKLRAVRLNRLGWYFSRRAKVIWRNRDHSGLLEVGENRNTDEVGAKTSIYQVIMPQLFFFFFFKSKECCFCLVRAALIHYQLKGLVLKYQHIHRRLFFQAVMNMCDCVQTLAAWPHELFD